MVAFGISSSPPRRSGDATPLSPKRQLERPPPHRPCTIGPAFISVDPRVPLGDSQIGHLQTPPLRPNPAMPGSLAAVKSDIIISSGNGCSVLKATPPRAMPTALKLVQTASFSTAKRT